MRARVEAAVLEALEGVGPEMLDRGAVIQQFHGQGISVRTLYRWAADYIDSGRAGQALAGRVAEAFAARAARVPDPAADAAREAVERLPKSITVETISGAGSVSVMLHLQEAIQAAQQVMKHAKTPEGVVRNAKLLLSASTSLRQCLDTALRIFEAMHSISEIEKFHSAVRCTPRGIAGAGRARGAASAAPECAMGSGGMIAARRTVGDLPAMQPIEVFSCERRAMTLTRVGCARLWLSAQERRPEPYEGRATCLTCELGAAHTGYPVEAVPAWHEALRVVCAGCGRVSDQIILYRLCVSYRNRRLEAEKDRNGIGGRPGGPERGCVKPVQAARGAW